MNKLKKKAVALAIVELLCLVILGVYLTRVQNSLSIRSQEQNTRDNIAEMRQIADDARATSAQIVETYDGIYKAKASTLAYMIRQGVRDDMSSAVMEAYRALLDVDNLLILDRSGRVVAQARRSASDFTNARFDQLRTVFETDEPSVPFQVDTGDGEFRYYGAPIDRDTMAVVEHNAHGLEEALYESTTWQGMLEHMSVGMNGFAFAISAKDYTFLYHPDERMTGMNALEAGIVVDELTDGNRAFFTMDGERFYCGVVKTDDAYLVCAISEAEVNASNGVTVGVVMFIFFLVITIVVAYGIFMFKDEQEAGSRAEDYRFYRHVPWVRSHKRIGRKVGPIFIPGLAAILIVSFYMQTIFSLSHFTTLIDHHVTNVQSTLERYQANFDTAVARYNQGYLSKAKALAYILTKKPELANKQDLAQISRALGVEYSFLFDEAGNMVATDSYYSYFTLSEDPESQSYPFRVLLQGVPYLIQEARVDDIEHVYRQYVGVTLRDERGEADGFVEISMRPELLEKAIANLNLTAALQKIRVGSSGFAFAVDKETKTLLYHPVKKYIGRSAEELGMKESAFRDDVRGYFTLAQERVFGSCLETDDAYVYVVVPTAEIDSGCLRLSLSCAGVSAICLILIGLVLTFEPSDAVIQRPRRNKKPARNGKEGKPERMVDVLTADGMVKKSKSILSRWDYGFRGWAEMTAEQKVLALLHLILTVDALIIVIGALLPERFFDSLPIFRYIIGGTWERGVNIFAITACVMMLCVVSVANTLLKAVFRYLSRSLNAQGETICRMLANFVKYISAILVVYYCLSMFGVDTATLVASAGILSLVVGLGAQDLVKDIVAGLFIIFEGEFSVGDMITIGDYRGTVVEIGVRTTKVEAEGDRDIRIFNNSNISNVINMTRNESRAICDISIEYGESLERVESVLAAELPDMRRRLKGVTKPLKYVGVLRFENSGIVLRITAPCSEIDRSRLTLELNREVLLMFERNHINIPFPQVVVNRPVEFTEAAEWRTRRAQELAEKEQD